MYVLTVIMQGDPGGTTNALGILNTLNIAIFLVFIGLLLLMSAHWYRMKDQIDRKHKVNNRASIGRDEGAISRLQYMSRSEMKEMILQERSKAPQNPEETDQPEVPVEDEEKLTPIGYGGESELAEEEKPAESPGEAEPEPEAPPSREPSEADVLARILMEGDEGSDEEKQPEKKKAKPDHPYSDRVERSISSNETLEEFRRRSRRI